MAMFAHEPGYEPFDDKRIEFFLNFFNNNKNLVTDNKRKIGWKKKNGYLRIDIFFSYKKFTKKLYEKELN